MEGYPTSMIRSRLHGLYILGSKCLRYRSWIRVLSIQCRSYLPCSGLCMRFKWLTGKEGSAGLCFWMTDYERKEILQSYGYLFPAFRRVFENKYMLLFKADTGYICVILIAVRIACCSKNEVGVKSCVIPYRMKPIKKGCVCNFTPNLK